MGQKKIAGYVRVSRIGGRKGEGYISVPDQQERMGTYLGYLDDQFEVEWFVDEDFSGGNTDRPKFQEAIARIEAGELHGLAVVRIDRFSRSVQDGVEWVDKILKAGGTFMSATEQLNFQEDIGHYMLVTFLNNAELQLRGLKRQWVNSKERAIQRGVHIGPTPFGYGRVPKDSDTGGSVLVPHPVEAPAVLRAFELRRDGASYAEIARYLDTVGPPRRSPRWGHTTVARMLQLRAYLGEVRWGDLPARRDAHEALLPTDLFDAVQGKLATKPHQAALRVFPLRGLVRCAHCRRVMPGRSRMGKGARGRAHHRCGNNVCAGKAAISVELLEPYVIDAFWAAMDAERERIADVADDDHAGRIGELDADIADVEHELVRVSTREYRKQYSVNVREAKERELQAELDALHAERGRLARDTALKSSDAFTFRRDEVDDAMLPRLMARMVKYVFVRSGRLPLERKVMIVLHDGPDFDVPHRGGSAVALGPIPWPEDDGNALAA